MNWSGAFFTLWGCAVTGQQALALTLVRSFSYLCATNQSICTLRRLGR